MQPSNLCGYQPVQICGSQWIFDLDTSISGIYMCQLCVDEMQDVFERLVPYIKNMSKEDMGREAYFRQKTPLVWVGYSRMLFSRLSKMTGSEWILLPEHDQRTNDESETQYEFTSRVHYRCLQCQKTWTSNFGGVTFTPRGTLGFYNAIYFKLKKAACQHCNRDTHPQWSLMEIIEVINKLCVRVFGQYYASKLPMIEVPARRRTVGL